jgi:dienelactone hydrolase
MQRKILGIICCSILLLINTAAQAQSIRWQETTIPMPEAGPKGLETLLVWPDLPGKHPLALISHGSPRLASQRAEMTAMSFLPIATEFARRGFAVAVVLRRGYGRSGGGWAEGYGSCQATNYKRAALASSADLHAAIDYLSTLPQFDVDRMIAVGVSAGGFATVALTADSPPKGLVAAISFAGGRGSSASNTICQENALVSTFGFLGQTSRTPMLWIYAKNDHFFNPAAAARFLHAFNANGGNATLVETPAFDTEGHTLFSTAGIPVWSPIVDHFLTSQHLVLLNEKLPLPPVEKQKPPSQLSIKNKKEFDRYLASPPHKAFAVDKQGAFGWSSGRHTVDEAKKKALTTCQKFSTSHCELYIAE